MEPSVVPFGWGRSAWKFLHGVTLDPLSEDENKKAQKKLLKALRHILPCPKCKRSYCVISRDLNEIDHKDIADYVLQLHDKVNIKLDKENAKYPWTMWKKYQLSQFREDGYFSYVEDMFYFLFVLACNYPTQYTEETEQQEWYGYFFQNLPLSMNQRKWGQIMEKFMRRNNLKQALRSRQKLVEYVYDLYVLVLPEENQITSLETICETIETIRKKKE